MKTISALTIGQSATVDLAKVAASDNSPPYLALVRRLVRKGEGSVYIASLSPVPAVGVPQMAYVRSWSMDLLGDVRIPANSLTPIPA